MNAPLAHPVVAQEFPLLLSPLRVGRHALRNRVVMGSMHTRLETLDRSRERLAAFYERRARGGVGLIISGGHAPNAEGLMEEGAPWLREEDLNDHRAITEAVHAAGSKMLLQILHAGRYARHADVVAPSAIASVINPRLPRAMTEEDIARTIDDYVRTTELALRAGYDGVEIMGSEGYLLNQFTAPRTNARDDAWGGPLENRIRLPVVILRAIRDRLGPEPLLMYRISAIDLVEGGASADDIDVLALAVSAAGADVLNTGVGWHESRVPTIAYPVPRAAWAFAAARLKAVVSIPVVTSNRINTPELAEGLLRDGAADLVSLARPLLADPDFVAKTARGEAKRVNVCIACNQACLDYIFSNRTATCLVNPEAGRELDFVPAPAMWVRRIAVVGAGAAGLAAATVAARRGHRVTLHDASDAIGGQLNLAAAVPGKDEFRALLGYFAAEIDGLGVELALGRAVSAPELQARGFDHVVVATGVRPRRAVIEGIDHPMVHSYADILSGRAVAGASVVVVGGGGIGFDVAEFLSAGASTLEPQAFLAEWGVDERILTPGGLKPRATLRPPRTVTLVQRSPDTPGRRLGRTTGWILRERLKRHGVTLQPGCHYVRIDDQGLHALVNGEPKLFLADTIVLCTGQESISDLACALERVGLPHTIVGGARDADAIDARRAIEEGTRAALSL